MKTNGINGPGGRGFRRVWIGLGLAVLAGLAAGAAAQNLTETERLQFADGLYSRGMYAPAAKEYTAYLKDFPQSRSADVARFRLGECDLKQGNTVEAEKEFARVFATSTNVQFRCKAGYRRAEIFLDAKQYEAAADLFQTVLKTPPPADIAEASTYSLGDALLQAGKADAAEKALRQIPEKYPKSLFGPYALLKLGQIEAAHAGNKTGEGAGAKALDDFQRAGQAATTDRVRAEALFQTAEVYFRAGQYRESYAAYRDLLTKYPGDERSGESRLQAAWSAHDAGQYADALRLCDETLKLNAAGDRKDEWLYVKANCERQLLQHAAAVQTYLALLSDFPHSRFAAPARYEKALALFKAGRYEEAIADAQKIELTPDMRPHVYWLFAEAYAALKQDENAIQYYRLVTQECADSEHACDAMYRLAHYLQERGELKEASRYYDALAAKWPAQDLAPVSLFASAACLARSGANDDAARDWSLLVRNYPKHELVSESLYQKAMSEMQLKRNDDAMATLQDLLKRAPASPFRADAFFWEGMLQRQTGQPQEAEGKFRLALQANPGEELGSRIRFYLAGTLYDTGQKDEAAQLFQPLVDTSRLREFPPDILEWLSGYEFAKGEFAKAAAVGEALARAKTEPEWQQTGWALAGRAYRGLGDAAKEEASFRKAASCKASTAYAPEACLRLGELALAKGDQSEAETSFSRAAATATDDASLAIRAHAYEGLGQTASARGDFAGAARYFMGVAVLYDDPELTPKCLHEAAQAFDRAADAASAAAARKELAERYPKSPWAAGAAKPSASHP